MTYKVDWSQRSKKDLQELDKKTRSRIIAKVESIRENPFEYVKHLVGVPLYSLRVGDRRVIMDIQTNEMLIFVVKTGPRRNVYDKL